MGKPVSERSLLSLTWPIFIDTLLVFCINLADAWFLSRISDSAAAAVGAVLPIAAMCFTFFIALNMAGCTLAARSLGANQTEDTARIFGVLMYACAVVGIVMSACLLFLAPTFASLMGLVGQSAMMGTTYLHTLGFGVLLLALRYGFSGILQAYGLTHWNMLATLAMTIVNGLLNYALVTGSWGLPALGVKGIAIATITAWGVNLALSAIIVLPYLKIAVKWRFDWAGLKQSLDELLRIAIPACLEPLSWHISQLVIMAMVVSLGEYSLAARVYAFQIIFCVIIFTIALSAGVQLKISHFYGAGRNLCMQKTLLKSVRAGIAIIVAILATTAIFAEPLLSLFTQEPAIIALGKQVLWLAIFCEIGRLLNMVVGLALKSTGHARWYAQFGITTMWLLSVPLAWLLALYFDFGLAGIWLAMGIDELFRGMVACVYWQKQHKARLNTAAEILASPSPSAN